LPGSEALGVVGKGIGKIAGGIANSMANETAAIGKDAAKEIARNGGKFTVLARELISKGKEIAKSTESY
jgi:hypothetical protein